MGLAPAGRLTSRKNTMPRETFTTPAGLTTSTWTCKRCGRAFPKDDLIDDLCPDDIDDDEYDDLEDNN
jgi:hypothetical protein